MRKSVHFVLFTLFSVLFIHRAEAQVTVETMIVSFSAGARPVRNFIVRNGGNAPLRVKADTVLVERGGFPDEKLIPTEDFLVSPKEFSIPAQGQRTVRLLVRKPNVERQQTFRASFIPEAREDEESPTLKKNKGKGMQLKVMTGMGILVFVDPPTVDTKVEWEREGDTVKIKNVGNANFFLEDLSLCSREDEDLCSPVEPIGKRMYPDNVLEVSNVGDKILKFRKQVESEDPEEVRIE